LFALFEDGGFASSIPGVPFSHPRLITFTLFEGGVCKLFSKIYLLKSSGEGAVYD
jgi:hypothetical protein